MKNHIKVVPRHKFKSMVEGGVIDSDTAVISIHEPRNKIIGGFVKEWPEILPSSNRVLNLWFNDCEEPNEQTEAVLFDEAMAERVLKFVEANKNSKQWVLHCTMGKSRSGAVGSFLADYFEIDWFDFKRENSQVSPNTLVRKLLTKVWQEKFGG